ncbi:MAG TPA: serine/threonine-protein kinase, partial [Nannocystaceae bacterium]|nr:serine/threonine-protein kinase [Nannocystaceae bacterium]
MTDESIDDGGTPARALSPPSDTVDYASTLHNVTRALLGHERDGPRIGPYYVLHRIGAGGMGVVWAAYDPELDRRIAIKVLHRDDRDDGDSVGRLVQEARALARLSHPNVVTVYGAGVYERGAFVAMEFVDGQTLAGWLKGEAKPWRSVLAMLLQAGRGLAAAHAAGIVHRDFKPDNVLVGNDGIGRVADFGLARPRDIIDGPTPAERSSPSLDTAQTHQLIGTPAYVAPEQVIGEPPVPSADQFAFAVSCWEALVGAPPHAGRHIGELLEARRHGRIEPPPRGCQVPRRLLRTLERAMSPGPLDRFPDMPALLAAMERESGLGARRWVLSSVAIAATLSVGAYALGRAAPTASGDTAEPCTGFERHLDGVWDESRRARVVETLEEARYSWAAEAATTLAAALDRHANDWLIVRTEACRANRAGEISAEMLDFRTSCLDRNLAAFDGTIDVLTTPDPRVIGEAHGLVARLPRPSECDAVAAEVLLIAKPSDPDERAAGAALLNDVARLYPRIDVHLPLGEDDRATVDGLMARAESSRDMNARGEVWRFAAMRTRDPIQRETLLRRAIADGLRARNDELVFQAAYLLVGTLTVQGRTDDAIREADLAEAYNDRLASWGGDAPRFRGLTDMFAGELENQRGVIESTRARTDAALSHYDAALAHFAPYPDRASLSLMRLHNNIGEALRSSGRGFEAMVHYDAAIAVGRRKLPARHPEIGSIHNNRGAALVELGAIEAGEADLRLALAVAEADGDSQPLAVGLAKLNLA